MNKITRFISILIGVALLVTMFFMLPVRQEKMKHVIVVSEGGDTLCDLMSEEIIILKTKSQLLERQEEIQGDTLRIITVKVKDGEKPELSTETSL